jgi:hypothetical protein
VIASGPAGRLGSWALDGDGILREEAEKADNPCWSAVLWTQGQGSPAWELPSQGEVMCAQLVPVVEQWSSTQVGL